MAISEKKLNEIRRRFDKSNKLVMDLYRKNGDESLLEMLYLDSEDPNEVAEKFDIPLETAEKLVEKDKAIKADPIKTMEDITKNLEGGIFSKILGKTARPEKSELYDKAFEFVASSGNEEPEALAEALGITVEQAGTLIEEMRERGDIAAEDDEESDEDEYDDDEDDESDDIEDDDTDDDSEPDLSDFPEKVIETVCFIGDVVQDVSEKICDVLDETVERIKEFDFDF